MSIEKYRTYSNTFSEPTGKKVLEDLERFCFFNDSTVMSAPVDANYALLLEGRRQVILYIKSNLKEPVALPEQDEENISD